MLLSHWRFVGSVLVHNIVDCLLLVIRSLGLHLLLQTIECRLINYQFLIVWCANINHHLDWLIHVY